MERCPPIIIIGMSRSGTTLLAKMLEGLGLFIGSKKNKNQESIFFNKINRWILMQCNGGIENPKTISYLLEDKETRKLCMDFIRHIMKTPHVISFLGLIKYLRYFSPVNLDISWGWKDPRNTFTLPLWLDIFPDAKIIHIYRHGVDVSKSLMLRREKSLSRSRNIHASSKPLYLLYPTKKFLTKQKFFAELRCDTLENGFTLWEEYINEARTHVTNLKDRAIEVKYEEVLLEPSKMLKRIANFCGLETTDGEIVHITQNLNKGRAYAYLRNPDLTAFADKVAHRLKIQGY